MKTVVAVVGVMLIGVLALIIAIPLIFLQAWAFSVSWELLANPYGWVLPFSIKQLVVILFLKGMILNKSADEKEAEGQTKTELVLKVLKPVLVPLVGIVLAYFLSLVIH